MKASRVRTLLLETVLAPFGRLAARQLGGPDGLFGRVVMTRLLNRGNRPLIEATLEALAPRPGESLLDVGFGGGIGLELASGRGVRRLAGADPSAAAVASTRKRLRRLCEAGLLRLERARVTALPYADGEFDAVLTTNTIYFWPELGPAFGEIRRVLSPEGGRLALGFSGAEKLRSFGRVTRHGFCLRGPDEVRAALLSAGFEGVSVSALDGRVTVGDFVAVGRRG